MTLVLAFVAGVDGAGEWREGIKAYIIGLDRRWKRNVCVARVRCDV